MDLTWVFPQYEAVTIGTRDLVALPLRLADLALLQGYAKRAVPCPLDAVRSQIRSAADGSEARRRLLRDAYLACEGWPARLGSSDGQALLATEGGLRFWLSVALHSENPWVAGDVLDELVATMTVGQYERLVRICYGAAPLDELTRLITPDSFPDSADEPTNWGHVIRNLVIETGWTFAECGEVRLPQLAAFQSDGKAGQGAVEPPPGMGRWAFSRRQRRFFGPDLEELEERV